MNSLWAWLLEMRPTVPEKLESSPNLAGISTGVVPSIGVIEACPGRARDAKKQTKMAVLYLMARFSHGMVQNAMLFLLFAGFSHP
jgi:hypothetical protein